MSIVLAHAFLQTALVSLHTGVRRLRDGQAGRIDITGYLVIALTFGVALWFTYIDPNFEARLILVASTTAFLVGRTAWLLSGHSRRMGGSVPANVLAGLWWLVVSILIITVLATLTYGEQAKDLWQAGPQVTTLLDVRPVLIVLIVCFAIWMELQAMRAESREHAHRNHEAIEAGRAAYAEQCAREIAAAGTSPLWVALIDLDNHRTVRRQHGHAAADALLAWTENTIRGALQNNEGLERHGTDHFILIAPRASLTEARLIAHEIHKRIETGTCIVGRTPIQATVSIGMARLQAGRATPAALAAAAHVALYKARSAGRNRTEIADDATP